MARGKRNEAFGGETPGKGHNSKTVEAKPELTPDERDERIRKAKNDIRALEVKRNGYREEANGVSKKITQIFGELKADLDMQRNDLEFAFRLIDLEEGKRGSTLETLRKCFNAVGIGQQLDFITAAGPELGVEQRGSAAKSDPRPSFADLSRAQDEGLAAGLAGKSQDANPYANGDGYLFEEWDQAWQRGQAKLANDMGVGTEAEAETAGAQA